MAGDFEVRVFGSKELREALLAVPAEFRRGILLKALKAGMKIVLQATARNPPTPMLKKPVFRKGVMIREPGTIIRNIKVRTSKNDRQEGNVGVFLNVKPATGANRGTLNPKDPYFWRWQSFGSKHNKRTDFLTKGATGLSDGSVLAEVERKLAPDIQALNSKVSS